MALEAANTAGRVVAATMPIAIAARENVKVFVIHEAVALRAIIMCSNSGPRCALGLAGQFGSTVMLAARCQVPLRYPTFLSC